MEHNNCAAIMSEHAVAAVVPLWYGLRFSGNFVSSDFFADYFADSFAGSFSASINPATIHGSIIAVLFYLTFCKNAILILRQYV